MFREPVHHDAHEFLNYLLNAIADILTEQQRQLTELQFVAANSPLSPVSPSNLQPPPFTIGDSGQDNNGKESENCGSEGIASKKQQQQHKTWIHELFEGVLVNETRCLVCENVSLCLLLPKIFSGFFR